MNQQNSKIIQTLTAVKIGELTVTQAAIGLGVSRQTIYTWLAKIASENTSETGQNAIKRQPRNNWVSKNSLDPKFEIQILKLIKNQPQLKIVDLYNYVSHLLPQKISWHGFYNCLKRNNLLTQENRQAFINSQDDTTASFRQRMVEKVVIGKYPVTSVANEYGISRQSLYTWINRYKKEGSQALTIKKTAYKTGLDATAEDVQMVLDQIIYQPQLSYAQVWQKLKVANPNFSIGRHGIYNIYKKYNLSHQNDRLYYSQKFAPIVQEAPKTAQTIDSVSIPSLDQLSPQVLPAPPPVISEVITPEAHVSPPLSFKTRIFNFFKISIISASLSLSVVTILFNLSDALISARSGKEFVGLIFAVAALSFGMFFFMYSMKYYLTIAFVLLFSRKNLNVKESEISNVNSSSIVSKTGLIPDLSQIEL
ncbi:MAG: hypothetical protein UR52_C0027G0001, partial [Candidatus Gottesmanbacteria bacterium GW2011_GWA1_34_13]